MRHLVEHAEREGLSVQDEREYVRSLETASKAADEIVGMLSGMQRFMEYFASADPATEDDGSSEVIH